MLTHTSYTSVRNTNSYFTFGEDGEDAVADVGNNADLYAANQESTDLINEARM